MEGIREMLLELLLSFSGVVLTAVFTYLGTLFGSLWKEKFREDWLRDLAKTCVQATEQMYRDQNGEEKLKKATELCENLAAEKGISLSAERIRVILEAAVGNLKQAFQNEVAA